MLRTARAKKELRRLGAYVLLGAFLFIGLILGTPFLLRAIGPRGTDWAKLSDISQAYGAVSVPLSAVALAGVIASLAYQARQTRIAQEETNRTTHRELVLLSIANPQLRQCWEPPEVPMTTAEWERIAFTNLIMSSWENAYRLGSLTDAQLRLTFRGHFSGRPARTHWSHARSGWFELTEEGTDRRARSFAIIAEECYQAAIAAGPGVAASNYYAGGQTPGASDPPV